MARRLGSEAGNRSSTPTSPEEPRVLHVTTITTVARELDFSTSSGGRCAVTAVTAGDVQLCNAVELLEVEAGRLQVEVCECCGHRGCAPGGWVALLRCGEFVVWVPAWEVMERGLWEANEYQPPANFAVHGSPVFAANAWEELRRLRPEMPAAATLTPLTAREASRLVQLAAPLQVLGRYPDPPRLRRDLLLGVVEGDLHAEAGALDRCLDAWSQAEEPVRPVSGRSVATIELLLDSMQIPTWVAFGRRDGTISLLLDGDLGFVIEPA